MDIDNSLCHQGSISSAKRAPSEEVGSTLVAAGGFDVGGIEYLEAPDGRMVFYDMNANSNLRAPIARAFGFDPFERVVDFLTAQMTVPSPG